MNVVLITIAVLAALGCVAAVILYFVAQKFKVYEDPKIGQVEEVLPGANCGGCGYPGCHGFAEALAKADDISGMACPAGGAEAMSKIAVILGKEVVASAPKVAVVRCGGSCLGADVKRQKTLVYDGAKSCAIASSHFSGDTACQYGCLGLGDCVEACKFGAIMIDESGLARVDEEKCVACGACVTACPKGIIELRNQGPKGRRLWVSCVNKDKGAAVVKACSVSCIGCGKCVKECAFDAIKVENNVAYIDFNKCKLCRKCVAACPRGAIQMNNLQPLPPKAEAPKVATPKAETPKVEKSEKPEGEKPVTE